MRQKFYNKFKSKEKCEFIKLHTFSVSNNPDKYNLRFNYIIFILPFFKNILFTIFSAKYANIYSIQRIFKPNILQNLHFLIEIVD